MVVAELDALIAGFYAAATGAQSWSRALGAVQQALGTRSAALNTVDRRSGQVLSIEGAGSLDLGFEQAALHYVRDWHAWDPRVRHVLADPATHALRWTHCRDLFDERFVTHDRFYQHYLPAWGIRYASAQLMLPDDHTACLFALEIPPGRAAWTAEEQVMLDRLGRHLHEALRQRQRVQSLALAAAAGPRLGQALPYPLWLLEEGRAVLWANTAAAALPDDRVAVQRGRLRLCASAADQRLSEALVQRRWPALVSLRSRAGDPPAWLHLTELRPERVMGAFGAQPCLMATLLDPSITAWLDPHALGELFGLTPAQARVAAAMGEGLDAERIAQRLGCAPSTVRTHWRAVMAAFGAHRASEVVRLLARGDVLWATAGAVAQGPT